jgi:hypothetical protein
MPPASRRHSWGPTIKEDLRKDVHTDKRKTERCIHCGIWRQYTWLSARTVYLFEPYGTWGYHRAPSCPDVERYMRAVAPELFTKLGLTSPG